MTEVTQFSIQLNFDSLLVYSVLCSC